MKELQEHVDMAKNDVNVPYQNLTGSKRRVVDDSNHVELRQKLADYLVSSKPTSTVSDDDDSKIKMFWIITKNKNCWSQMVWLRASHPDYMERTNLTRFIAKGTYGSMPVP